MQRAFLIDTDTASDDAVAIIMALRAPDVRVDAIIEAIDTNPGLVIVTLAPLTNLALALAKKPDIAAKVGRCVVMGGAPCCEGNVTPAAEYNIWVDPEAARVVMLSGLPIELIGWHLCRGDAVLHDEDITRIMDLNNNVARFA